MKPFVRGDDRINRGGRPRRIDREIERLAEAAQHARALLEQRALVTLMEDDPEIRQVHERRLGEGLRALADIEARLATLRELAEEVEAAPSVKGRRRKRRQHSPDPWEVEAMAAAASLDRMLFEGSA